MDCRLNRYEETGTRLIDLGKAITELDDCTRREYIEGKDIVVCHVPNKKYYKGDDGNIHEKDINTKEEILSSGQLTVNAFHGDEYSVLNYSESGLAYVKNMKCKISNLLKAPIKEELIDELLETRTFFLINRKMYLLGNFVDATLSQRAKMDGTAILDHTMLRDAHLAERLHNAGTMSAIVREKNSVAKIYSLLSSKYCYIKQSMIMDIIREIDPNKTLGNPVCHKWKVNNKQAYAFIEFPEKAHEISKTYKLKDELVPGIMVGKSDVGFSSIWVSGTWRNGNSISIFETVRKEHSGRFDPDDVIKDATVKIFGNYTKLPEQLCELMMNDITDPQWFIDYDNETAKQMNHDEVMSVIRNVFDQVNMTKAIQKKRTKIVLEELSQNIDPELHYTAYDICMLIMGLSSRISGMTDNYMESLMNALGKVPYVKYEKENSKKNVPMLIA